MGFQKKKPNKKKGGGIKKKTNDDRKKLLVRSHARLLHDRTKRVLTCSIVKKTDVVLSSSFIEDERASKPANEEANVFQRVEQPTRKTITVFPTVDR